MTTRRRRIASALALALVALGASVGVAAPSSAAETSPLRWELANGDSILVDGSMFGTTLEVAPGYSDTRTLVVTNDGQHPGTLEASVVNAVIDPGAHDQLGGLTVNGRSAPSLDGRATVLQTASLAPGESVEVPVTLAFSGPDGNSALVGPQTFRFDIRLSLFGDTPGGDANVVVDRDTTHAGGPVADTGGSILRTNHGLLLAAAALALGGLLALATSRRRRREVERV